MLSDPSCLRVERGHTARGRMCSIDPWVGLRTIDMTHRPVAKSLYLHHRSTVGRTKYSTISIKFDYWWMVMLLSLANRLNLCVSAELATTLAQDLWGISVANFQTHFHSMIFAVAEIVGRLVYALPTIKWLWLSPSKASPLRCTPMDGGSVGGGLTSSRVG